MCPHKDSPHRGPLVSKRAGGPGGLARAPRYARYVRLHLVPLALSIAACTPSGPAPPARETPEPPAVASAAPVRPLALAGLEVDVPADFVALEPERIEALRAAALAETPGATVEIVGARAVAGMAAGTVYLQRSEFMRDPGKQPLPVREVLGRIRDDMRARIGAAGLQLARFEVELADDARAGAFDVRMTRDGRTIGMYGHARFVVVDAARVVGWNVQCMIDGERPGPCAPVLASRRATAPAGLALDELLPATLPSRAPIAGLGRDAVAGVVFGASPAQFAAACRKAGLELNGFDFAREPAVVRTWVDEGRMAQCSGLPLAGGPALELGPALTAIALFADRKLSSLTLHLDADPAVVAARLADAYPEAMTDGPRRVHLIDRDAAPDELVTVGLGPQHHPVARTTLTFISPRNLAAAEALAPQLP